jgi:hypothetical protein
MLVKIKINKQTLEWSTDDDTVVVNHFIEKDHEFEIEISKPDPESPTTTETWQQ